MKHMKQEQMYVDHQVWPTYSSFVASHVGGWRLSAGENANHQLLLAVDTWVVGELYSGLPNWKDHFSANVSFTAPQVPWNGNTGMACGTVEVRMDPGSELGLMGYNLTYL